MFQLTILFLYIIAGVAFSLSRLPRYEHSSRLLFVVAFLTGLTGLLWHLTVLWAMIAGNGGLSISLGNAVSFIGFQLALIGLLGSFDPPLRGLTGGLLILAAFAAALTGWPADTAAPGPMDWQLQAHIMISMFAYGLLSVGAIVAIYALVQESRLHAAKIGAMNHLFAPLETTERLLFGITAAGFSVLLLAVFSGFAFVDNLFAQHLVHKTSLSLLALILFGVLIAGRQFAGWRGRRAIYLYLWGFGILLLAYFGTRFVLENVLGRSWG